MWVNVLWVRKVYAEMQSFVAKDRHVVIVSIEMEKGELQKQMIAREKKGKIKRRFFALIMAFETLDSL